MALTVPPAADAGQDLDHVRAVERAVGVEFLHEARQNGVLQSARCRAGRGWIGQGEGDGVGAVTVTVAPPAIEPLLAVTL